MFSQTIPNAFSIKAGASFHVKLLGLPMSWKVMKLFAFILFKQFEHLDAQVEVKPPKHTFQKESNANFRSSANTKTPSSQMVYTQLILQLHMFFYVEFRG